MTNSIAYEVVEPVFDELSWTWCDKSGEQAWTRYAWNLLAEIGLTDMDTDDSRNEVVIRVVALWAFTKVFYSKMFEEGLEQDWQYSVELAVGQPPFIEQSWVESHVHDRYELSEDCADLGENYEVPRELFTEVLLDLVRETAADIAPELQKILGEAALFAALARSGSGDATYPLDNDSIAEVFDSVTWKMEGAYGWVSNDLSI